MHKKIISYGNLKPQGISTLRAFEKGTIQSLLDKGLALDEAIAQAMAAGKLRGESRAQNLVVSLGKTLVGTYLRGLATSLVGITYFAIGTGTTTPALADVKLTTEYFRKAITFNSMSGNVVTFSTYMLAAECTVHLKEAGLFGVAASGVADSGTLFSHFLQSFDNSAGEYDLTFEYNLTIG